MRSIKSLLEQVTNVAILLVCGLLIWFFFGHRELLLHRSGTTFAGPSLQGNTLPDLPGYTWNAHPSTLVLGVQKGCHFCQESMPFYKALSDAQIAGSIHAHLLAVMPDPQAAGQSYIHSNGLQADGVFDRPLADLKISGTPTLMLVDSSGKVMHAWMGRLTQAQEKEVMNAVE